MRLLMLAPVIRAHSPRSFAVHLHRHDRLIEARVERGLGVDDDAAGQFGGVLDGIERVSISCLLRRVRGLALQTNCMSFGIARLTRLEVQPAADLFAVLLERPSLRRDTGD